MDIKTNKLIREKRVKPQHFTSVFDAESREREWDSRYANLDIDGEQRKRRAESEYQQIIDIEIDRLVDQKGKDFKCIELACGTAPWATYLNERGFVCEISDYSDIVVERLKKEKGLKGFKADISNLHMVPDNTYDLIIIAGAIYENPDPLFVDKVYNEFVRVLKPGGVLIQFFNRFLNRSNVFTVTKNTVHHFGHPLNNILLRKMFRRKKANKIILFWLLSLDFVRDIAKQKGLLEIKREYIQFEVGLSEILFFAPIFKNRSIFSQEEAYPLRDKIFRNWFVKKADKNRKNKVKDICRSAALVFKKSSEK